MELDLVFVSPERWIPPCITMFISCSLYTAGSMTGFDASGHIAEETRHAKHVPSPPPHAPLIDIRLKYHRRPRNADHRHTHWNHGISRHNPLPVLHSRSKYPLFIKRPPTVRTDLRVGAGEGALHLHDRCCSDQFDYRKCPSTALPFND